MSQIFAEPGTLFAQKYRVEELLGSGGFSQVYRATQLELERPVALKLLRPAIEPKGTPEQIQGRLESLSRRFLREARMVSQLRSPYTITVYDYGRVDELLFMSLEYVDGVTLTALIEQHGALEPRRVVCILKQVLQSLKEAHALGVLHRDIKPQNIMVYEHLGERDQVKLLDFGILKRVDEERGESLTVELTEEGTRVGTPKYMAPEYIRAGEVSPATDLYSLGLVAYNLLAGEHPIGLNSSIQVLGMQLDSESFVMPEHLDISSQLRAIIERMICKDLSERYLQAEEVLAALEAISEQAEHGYRRGDVKTLNVQLKPLSTRHGENADLYAAPEAVRTETDRGPTTALPVDAPHHPLSSDERAELSPKRSARPLWFGALAALALATLGVFGALLWARAAPLPDDLSPTPQAPAGALRSEDVSISASEHLELAPDDPSLKPPALRQEEPISRPEHEQRAEAQDNTPPTGEALPVEVPPEESAPAPVRIKRVKKPEQQRLEPAAR